MTKESKRIILNKFTIWLALSDDEKQAQGLPLTQKEFAIHHGIRDTQLSRWKAKIELQPLSSDDQEWQKFMVHLTADVLQDGAKTRDRELYARLLGKLIEKREDKVSLEFTANDYNQIASQVVERLREQLREVGGNCPLCGKPQILLNEIREDIRQDTGNHSVATLVAPSLSS